MAKRSNKIIVAENAQTEDGAFGKTITIDNLFKGANRLATFPEVEKIEITRFSDMVITLKDLPGQIHIANYNGSVIYKNGCKPKHVKFVAEKLSTIKALKNVKIF
jgi:hypothetical protein